MVIKTTIPAPAFDRLRQLEAERGIYRTRIAAEILTTELIGGLFSGHEPQL